MRTLSHMQDWPGPRRVLSSRCFFMQLTQRLLLQVVPLAGDIKGDIRTFSVRIDELDVCDIAMLSGARLLCAG
jgi:hypothetical protein